MNVAHEASRPAGPSILCLHGSPRRGGNTDLLLEALADGARRAGARVDHLNCRTLRFRPCTGCGACSDTGLCILDDALGPVYEMVDDAAALVVGAPVYFLGVPASLKALIDRFQCRWSRRYLMGLSPGPERPGVFLSAAGSPASSVFTCAQRTVEAFFDVLGVACKTNLLYPNVDGKGAVREHPTALGEARDVGTTLSQNWPHNQGHEKLLTPL